MSIPECLGGKLQKKNLGVVQPLERQARQIETLEMKEQRGLNGYDTNISEEGAWLN